MTTSKVIPPHRTLDFDDPDCLVTRKILRFENSESYEITPTETPFK